MRNTDTVSEIHCVQQRHFVKIENKLIHVNGDRVLTAREDAVPNGTEASNKIALKGF